MSSRQKSPKKPKAADNTQSHVQRASPAPTWLNVVRAAAFLFLAGVASPISQLNLSPVYGSIPASLHHQRSMTITAAAALLTRRAIKKYVSADLAPFVAVIAYWTPVIQYYLFSHSTELGIDYGPLIIESLTYLPVLFLAIYSAADLLESFIIHTVTSQSAASEALIPVLSYFAVSSVSKLASSLLPSFMGTSMYGTRVSLSLLVGGFSSLASIPSPMLALSFPAILHVLLANPHAWDGLANTALNTTHNYTLLARHESITGYISVLESHSDHAFRLLRCDHSLLGGEWLVTPAAYAKGQRNRESIFAVFVLLEAVRLIEPPPTIAPGAQESALVIGLGIGTAPNALIAHGINTTIVELDPIVHAYATKYFHLSPNHTAVIADAVQYVADTSLAAPRSFTYIIHDVFTGGAEPVYLFTSEFMRGLYDLLADDGVVAINYAGDVNLPATKLVLNTIHAVFPVCRLFRDSPPPPPSSSSSPSSSEEEKEEDKSDFINMVIFCHKTPHTPLSFRDATDADFLDSIARRNFLVPRDDLEVAYTYEEGAETMGRRDVGELEKYHKEGAVSHWRIMRSVLPAGVWEMW